jgi:glutamate synthase domain-containing protein 2
VVLAKKVTPEIAAIRGVEAGKVCLSPPAHTAFSDADSLLDFAELVAETSGLPVGIKSAVGQIPFWTQLTDLMKSVNRGLDFITIDGGEGGTGAAPLVFADHVALPFKQAFSRVYLQFTEQDLHKNLVFFGSGKLGFPESALVGFALGCIAVNVGREAMLSIGCIQAQRCHTGHCPAGVATQNQWLMRGVDPNHKSARLANYIKVLRKEIHRVCHASGISHPCLMDSHQVEISDEHLGLRSLEAIYGYSAHVRSGSAE